MSELHTPPPQHQDIPHGRESRMQPQPVYIDEHYRAAGKLQGKVAIISGADSGIGRAVAVHFAEEGCDIVLLYLDSHEDACLTQAEIEKRGRRVLPLAGDVADGAFCRRVIDETLGTWGRIDILINNAGEQQPQDNLQDISEAQWQKTFRTNMFGIFQLTKAALPHLKAGAAIINTSSITAYKGNPVLLDYSSTKGAITSFTRSLALNLVKRGIRVNAVAPGPIWTPLIVSTFAPDKVASFGSDTPMQRPGQPAEVAPAFVFLASNDSSYISGQVLHVNGGYVVNG
ncbi:MAG TPA: SDR family oxidoreductase [Chitinolyticbacter sp.]|nr:SDR family oxidoreductase [Chitinolyticbacter sp.]